MELRGATLVMFVNQDEIERSGFPNIEGYDTQDVEADETGGGNRSLHAHLKTSGNVGDSHRGPARPELLSDAPLEEAFHLVTDAGFEAAYPKLFWPAARQRPGRGHGLRHQRLWLRFPREPSRPLQQTALPELPRCVTFTRTEPAITSASPPSLSITSSPRTTASTPMGAT